MMVKILVVDDHALVRDGLCQVLKGLGGEVEVLQATHCAQAFQLADLHPDLDLVLLDFHLPDMNGLEALVQLGRLHPELPVVLLSGTFNAQIVRRAMKSGAAGFIAKSDTSTELLHALRLVLAGEIYNPTDLLLSLSPAQNRFSDVLALTARQEEVLQLLMDGLANKEISRALNLSAETTKNHVTAVLRHFRVKTRIQAVIAATGQGYDSLALGTPKQVTH